jgi:hypothetical protein
MPSIIRAPWAKLITFITPKMSVSPIATKPYTPPINNPSRSVCKMYVKLIDTTLFLENTENRGVVRTIPYSLLNSPT